MRQLPARLVPLVQTAGRRLAGLPRNPTALAMFALIVVSFLQRPGRTTFDTKLDLAVDPAAFLGRALHLWNPEATSGELQNQAYGYLFPIGPFFAGCQALGITPWIAQRLWCALLLCVAFAGALTLARALRIGTEPARYAGALAYALAPRMLTEIGPVSAEMLPAVMLPWVMVPLVRAGRIGSPRRAAGLSGLAVLCMGGVNGAMVVMAMVLPALWLLTRQWTREHVKLVLWWGASVLAAVAWWVGPLLLLGEYSLPFVDYVESASNTTAAMSLFEVVRGTNQWVAFVVQGTPWWPSGFMLIDNPLLMLATGLVAAIGLAGLVSSRLPERLFLTLGVLTGLTLLTVGYVGTLDSPLAESVRQLLDGPLAPLRNVHKFEPGLRLPLMLAFMHAISGLLPRLVRLSSAVWSARLRLAVGFLLVAVMAAPAWLLTLRPGPGWDSVPGYWHSAMTWLGDTDPNARVLLLPATGFGDYTWGHTVDEPAQALARSPWAVRSQIPLGSEGNIRLMDTVEDALASGRGSPGLADLLARSGYRFLLLRNDIDRRSTGSPPPSLLRAGLANSPGIERAATFGPDEALEIFEVQRPVPLVTAVSTRDIATVSGGPESLLQLLESQQLHRDQPTVLAGDGGAPGTDDWLITDGLRHRERNVGRVRDNLSQTLTADEAPRQNRPTTDILPFPGRQHQTVAAYRGVRAVAASTSAGFADAFGRSDPSFAPFAGVDGDPLTWWQSSSEAGPSGQWLEVELDTPRFVAEVTVRIVDDIRVGWPVTRIRVSTDAGSTDHDVARGSDAQNFVTAPGLTSTIRVTVLSVAANRQSGNVGIAELTVPGVTPQRAIVVPLDTPPDSERAVGFSFSRGAQPRYACISEGGDQRCGSELTRFGEEPHGIHRLFRTTTATTYRVDGAVLPAPGGRSPITLPGLQVSGSTQLGGDPAAGAQAAVDGNPDTSWIADVTDVRPSLRLKWSGARQLTGIHLASNAGSGGFRTSEVDISSPTETRSVALDENGRGSFTLTAEEIEIVVTRTAAPDGGESTSPARRSPAGVSELDVSGVDDLLRPIRSDTPFTIPCGAGPKITVDGLSYATSVSGTLADFTAHRGLRLRTCRDLGPALELPSGPHELRTDRSAEFVVQDLWLTPVNRAGEAPAHRDIAVRQWDDTHRRVQVGAGDAAVLSVPENASDGWVATVDGRPLDRIRVDGWQQAWLLPAGDSGIVSLDFVPDSSYRNRLLVGALTAVALLVVTAIPVRRRSGVPVGRAGQRCRWTPIALIGLLAVLGGMLPVILLIGCLLLRTIWRPAATALAFGGMAAACGVAVVGRLAGHGQEWAFGFLAQAAVLVSAAAVVSACIDWFDTREDLLERRT